MVTAMLILALLVIGCALFIHKYRMRAIHRNHQIDQSNNSVAIAGLQSAMADTLEKLSAYGNKIEECCARLDDMDKRAEEDLKMLQEQIDSQRIKSFSKYSEEFIAECVNYAIDHKGQDSLRKIAKDLEIPESTLRRWIKKREEE